MNRKESYLILKKEVNRANHAIVLVSGFLITFYSFKDGVTLYFFFTWSWLLPTFWISSLIFLLDFLAMVWSNECFFVLDANNNILGEKYWLDLCGLLPKNYM